MGVSAGEGWQPLAAPPAAAWACGQHEQFVVFCSGGPAAGHWLTAAGAGSWPLPGTLPRAGGRYVKRDQTEGMTRVNGMFRGAVYEWQEDLSAS